MNTIKNLVFRGGGVRGIAYVGALKVMEEEGLLWEQPGWPGLLRDPSLRDC